MENTLVTLKELVSEAQCYEAIRKLRWQENISVCDDCGPKRPTQDGLQRICDVCNGNKKSI